MHPVAIANNFDMDRLANEALGTALWICLDFDEGGNAVPLDENYAVADVSERARADIQNRLAAFMADHWPDVRDYLNSEEGEYGPLWPDRIAALAHDYVLTCNGEGAGFWDRGLGDLGERLTEAAEADGEWTLYVGDDGKLYA